MRSPTRTPSSSPAPRIFASTTKDPSAASEKERQPKDLEPEASRGGVLDLSPLLLASRIVDLSLTVSERLPGTWPGHMTFAHHNWNWFAEVNGPTGKTKSAAPYQTNFFVIDEHCGTHFDAPTHFIPPPPPPARARPPAAPPPPRPPPPPPPPADTPGADRARRRGARRPGRCRGC